MLDQESGATIRVIESQTGLGVDDVTLRISTIDGTLIGNYTTDRQGYIFVDLKPGGVYVLHPPMVLRAM